MIRDVKISELEGNLRKLKAMFNVKHTETIEKLSTKMLDMVGHY
jgi:hypothetical protein